MPTSIPEAIATIRIQMGAGVEPDAQAVPVLLNALEATRAFVADMASTLDMTAEARAEVRAFLARQLDSFTEGTDNG